MDAVSLDEVPNYLDVIKEPIDLSEIGRRFKKRQYKTKRALLADLNLMSSNCKKFNEPDTIYYGLALDLDKFLAADAFFKGC